MPKRSTKNSTIEVILLESDKHLGEKYEVVRVKPIFARNVLLPNGKAVLADAMNSNNYRQKMEAAEQGRAKKAQGFEDMLVKIQEDGGITLMRKVNKEGHLYAKIDEKEIAKEINATYKIDVEPHLFKMKKKLIEAGNFVIPFQYKDITGDIIVHVKPEATPKAAEENTDEPHTDQEGNDEEAEDSEE